MKACEKFCSKEPHNVRSRAVNARPNTRHRPSGAGGNKRPFDLEEASSPHSPPPSPPSPPRLPSPHLGSEDDYDGPECPGCGYEVSGYDDGDGHPFCSDECCIEYGNCPGCNEEVNAEGMVYCSEECENPQSEEAAPPAPPAAPAPAPPPPPSPPPPRRQHMPSSSSAYNMRAYDTMTQKCELWHSCHAWTRNRCTRCQRVACPLHSFPTAGRDVDWLGRSTYEGVDGVLCVNCIE